MCFDGPEDVSGKSLERCPLGDNCLAVCYAWVCTSTAGTGEKAGDMSQRTGDVSLSDQVQSDVEFTG